MNDVLIEAFIGQIQLFGFEFEPRGWMRCDGRTLPARSHEALYVTIGNRYGGEREKSFALPDLVGKEPIPGTAYCICVEGVFPVRW